MKLGGIIRPQWGRAPFALHTRPSLFTCLLLGDDRADGWGVQGMGCFGLIVTPSTTTNVFLKTMVLIWQSFSSGGSPPSSQPNRPVSPAVGLVEGEFYFSTLQLFLASVGLFLHTYSEFTTQLVGRSLILDNHNNKVVIDILNLRNAGCLQ